MAKKRWSKQLAKLLEKEKESASTGESVGHTRLEHENQLQKTLSDLRKKESRSKIQLLLQEKKTSFPKQNFWREAQLKVANEKVEFIRTKRPNSRQGHWGRLGAVCGEGVIQHKVAVLPFQMPYFERTTRSLRVESKATSASVMKMEWRLSALSSEEWSWWDREKEA